MIDDGCRHERIADLDRVILAAMRTPDTDPDRAQPCCRQLVGINARGHGPVADRTAEREGTELGVGPLLRLFFSHRLAPWLLLHTGAAPIPAQHCVEVKAAAHENPALPCVGSQRLAARRFVEAVYAASMGKPT